MLSSFQTYHILCYNSFNKGRVKKKQTKKTPPPPPPPSPNPYVGRECRTLVCSRKGEKLAQWPYVGIELSTKNWLFYQHNTINWLTVCNRIILPFRRNSYQIWQIWSLATSEIEKDHIFTHAQTDTHTTPYTLHQSVEGIPNKLFIRWVNCGAIHSYTDDHDAVTKQNTDRTMSTVYSSQLCTKKKKKKKGTKARGSKP